MKKLLIIVMLLGILGIGVQSDAVAPRSIVGPVAECNSVLFSGCVPALAASIVCTASCPLNTAPDLVVATRFWGIASGINCRVSTDSGVNWAACTTNPIAGNLTTRRHIAAAADGSIIVIGNIAGVCSVRRSTDLGVVWATVHTIPGVPCAGGLSGRTLLKCKTNGTCVFVSLNTTTIEPLSLISTDSGATWVTTEIATARSDTSQNQFAWNGSIGAQYIGGNGRAYLVDSTVFTQTGAWPALGFSVNCMGSYILGSTRLAMCLDSADDLYYTYDTVGVLVRANPMALARSSSASGDFVIVEGSGSTVLVAATQVTDGSGTAIGIWLSSDSGVSFTNIFTSIRPNEIVSGVGVGDVNAANGCTYFSAGSPVNFIRVC